MTPAVDIRPPPRRLLDRLRGSRVASTVLLLAFALGPLVIVDSFLTEDRAFVSNISFQNDSDYDVVVTVSDNASDSMALGVAVQHCVTTFGTVIDQGATWHLRFAAQGRGAGEAVVERSELVSNGWNYRIPESVAASVAAQGAPRSAPQSCRSGG